WEQPRLDEGEPAWVRVVHALEHYPTHFRASLVTSLTEAVPEGIVRLPGPSILPLVAALSLMTVFAAELYNLHVLAIVATVTVIAAILGWMWPPAIERERCLADDSGPTIHGLPIYLSGPRAPAWWGMQFVLLVMAVGSACVIFGYYYLQARNAEWPPMATPKPGALLPLVNLLVLGALSGAMFLVLRSIQGGQYERMLQFVSASGPLAVLFLIVQMTEFTRWGFTPDANAFTSAFGLLAGLQTTFVVIGLILSGVVTAHAWLGYFNQWRFLAIENVASYWYFATAHWLVLVVVLYLT
ncbi:MAG TPA: cytochrome c oxidase subunit 3, partial [Chloroflexota bacterium]|nr:cytochrome c oxidase subunit 3 [Chloroflexota bacterium]